MLCFFPTSFHHHLLHLNLSVETFKKKNEKRKTKNSLFSLLRWDAIIAVCLSSTFHATKAALPLMIERGWGRVVNTGSMHALVASPFKSAYNAAKHGVAGFTKTAALETARTGVTVNAVCPGYVYTDLIRRQVADQARTRGIPEERVVEDVLLVDQPTKKFVKVEEVAALVRFLCQDDAASVTGACLSVDGGWTAR